VLRALLGPTDFGNVVSIQHGALASSLRALAGNGRGQGRVTEEGDLQQVLTLVLPASRRESGGDPFGAKDSERYVYDPVQHQYVARARNFRDVHAAGADDSVVSASGRQRNLVGR
jgi:hypothetical protein